MELIYAKQVHDSLSDGNPIQAAFAPLFEHKHEGRVTTTTKIAVQVPCGAPHSRER